MHNLADYIAEYGYWALFIGCLAEGETITLLGGIAAHQGWLQLQWVIFTVALSGTIGDQIFYFIGRSYGKTLLNAFPNQRNRITYVKKTIIRNPMLFVIGVRFMYGLRIIGPLMIGATHFPARYFIPLNILGAILWATLFVSLGYLGGQAIEAIFVKFDKVFSSILITLLAIIGLIFLFYVYRKH